MCVITDPYFWMAAFIAVMITGISKGGFGGVALLAVPLMALTISPTKAAAIMLPILLVMDAISVWAWRKTWDKAALLILIPPAIIGIAIGGLFAGEVSDDFVRIMVGLVAVVFALYAMVAARGQRSLRKPGRMFGYIAGMGAGFTSFIAHAGGPLFQAYAIPQDLDKKVFTGTSVIFFTVVNIIKVIPYAMLGQFSADNITVSLMLIPLAPLGVWLGIWLNHRVPQAVFYKILYVLILLVGIKLLWDGLGVTG